jgi:hypothetical protein
MALVGRGRIIFYVVGGVLSLFATIGTSLQTALAAPNSGITYHGRILKKDGSPLEGTNVQFKIQIRSLGNDDCLMFEELQSRNMAGSSGVFAITINDGTGSRADASGYTLDALLANRGNFTLPSGSCTSGATSYNSNPSDGRVIVVYFRDESMAQWEKIPPQALNFVPMAIETKQIGGFTPQHLLRVEDAAVAANATPLTSAQLTELKALMGGTSVQYMKGNVPGGGASLPVLGTPPASVPPVGTIWYEGGFVWYSDGTTSAKLDTNGAVSGDSITTGTISGNTAINTSGNITTSGGISSSFNSTNNLLIYKTGNTFKVTVTAPAGLAADYGLVLPTALPASNGQVLSSDTLGNLSWIVPSGGAVTSVGVTSPILNSGTASAPVIAIQQAGGAQDGYLSSTDWTTFNSKLGTSLASGKIWVGDGGGAATAVTPSGDVTMTTSGGFTVIKIQGQAVSATAPTTAGQVLRWDGTSSYVAAQLATADISGLATALSAKIDSSQMPANCSANQTLTFVSPTGAWSCSNITVTGTAFGSQGANLVFAAPNGSAGDPTFRALASTDIPALDAAKITTGTLGVANGGTGLTSVATNSLMYGNGTGAMNALAPANSSMLTSTAGGVPQWSTLSGDTFSQYALLAGRAGGQSLRGGVAASENLTLDSTAHATKGNILMATGGGKVGIGTTIPSSVLDLYVNSAAFLPQLSTTIEGGSAGAWIQYVYTANSWGPQIAGYHARGTVAAPTALASGDHLVDFNGSGHDGTAFAQGGNIYMTTSEAWTPSAHGSRISFLTTSNGTTMSTARMIIDHNGNVGIGTATPGVSLDIGTNSDAIALPRGTTAQQPASPVGGWTRYNTSNNLLEFYNGTAWTSLAAAGSGITALTGDVTASGSGSVAASVVKVNGVTYPSGPSTNTVPVVTGANTVIYQAVPNAALANSSVTLGSTSVSLGATATTLAGLTSVGVGVDATTTGQLTLANGGALGTTVTMQNNAATAAYNFNLPATAGTSGYALTSGGGGVSPMTWTAVAPAVGSGNITTLGTVTTGTWNAGVILPTYGGTGVANPTVHGVMLAEGASNMVSLVGGAGTVLLGGGASADPTFTASPVLGVNATTTGTIGLANAAVGGATTTIAPSALTTAAYTFKLPASGGTSGYFLQTDGTGTTTWTAPTGSGTVNSGTANQLAFYAGTGTAVSGNANVTAANGALTLGQTGSVVGSLALSGNTSGVVTIAPQAAAGTYNFNLPTTAGTSAQVLASGGGAAAPMTWTTLATSATTDTTDATNISAGTLGLARLPTVTVPYGGTGLTSVATNSLLYGAGAGNMSVLAPTNSAVLTSTAGGVPQWSTLTSDIFTQYALLAGRAGGQSLTGGTAASENLTLDTTAHATKGNILLAPSGGNVGIGTTAPGVSLDVGAKTDAIKVASGTTVQRPTGANGLIRYNTDNNKLEAYINGGWQDLAAAATGGSYLSSSGGTLSGALTIASGGASITGGVNNNSGGVTNAGSITGVGANITGSGALTVAAGGAAQNLTLSSSTTGAVNLGSGNGTSLSVLDGGASTVNYVTAKGAATGLSPVIGVAGADANINLTLTPKGTGNTIFSSGNVGIGTTSPTHPLNVVTALALDRYGGNSPHLVLRGASGTLGSPTATASAGGMGKVSGNNYDGSSWFSGAAIDFVASEATTAANRGSEISFITTTNGTATAVERMRINNAGNVGIGTTSPAYPLSVSTSPTVTSGSNIGIYALDVVSPSAASSAWTRGILSQTQTGTASNITGGVIGLEGSVSHNTTSTVNTMYGISGNVSNSSTGTLTSALASVSVVGNSSTGAVGDAYGTYSYVVNQVAGGTITNASGLYTSVLQTAGTISNSYGLQIGSVQGTNKWSIYASDATAPSYFAGSVGIGTTNPAYLLELSGGALKLSMDGSNVGVYLPHTAAIRSGVPGGAAYMDIGNLYVRDGNGANANASVRVSGGLSLGNGYVVTIPPSNGAIIQGNVGVGTTVPLAKLHAGDGVSDYSTLSFTNTGAVVSSVGADHDQARSNVLTLMRDGVSGVRYAGAARFDISKWASDSVSARTQLDIRLADTDTSTLTDVLSLQSSGNVGIGTTTPGAKLEVASGTANTSGLKFTNFTSTAPTGTGQPVGVDASGNLITVAAGGSSQWTTASASSIYFGNDTASNTVGINTTTPSAALDVRSYTGNMLSLRNITNTQMATMTVTSSGGTSYFGMEGSSASGIMGGTLPFATVIGQTSGNPIQLMTSGQSRLIVASDGAVGVGTTTPGAKLDVAGHVANSGAAATVGTCGTSPTILGNDTRGSVTTGTGTVNSCVVTFNAAYSTTPFCVATWNGTTAPTTGISVSATTSALTVYFSASSPSASVIYHCSQ